MFNLSMVHSCVYSGAYGLANINISSFDAALCYIVAIAVSIVVALILRVPLLPSKPYMYSFKSEICTTFNISSTLRDSSGSFTFLCFRLYIYLQWISVVCSYWCINCIICEIFVL